MSSVRRVVSAAALALAGVLAGCAGSDPTAPAPSVGMSASEAAPTPSAPTDPPTTEPSPSRAPSPTQTAPAPPPTAPNSLPPNDRAPTAPPPVPTAPAPSTAGGLSEADLTVPDGWEPTARPGSPEEGYLGNGTWVHATSPEHSAYAAIALGCTDVGAYPTPVAALEGTIVGPDGQPGVGLALEFGSQDDAAAYFAEWTRQAEACVGTVTEKVSLDDETWVGRRLLDTVWSEAVALSGTSVRLLILDDPDADVAAAVG
ncbi:hypothetical protein [Tessaracoccus flavus]|uniref:hypothetical protein n=1 Tax=Tessaracoccus flavus TaxID=1610493 RepID=UPI00115FC83F|nr:hypothetical protein [Tessaracoccus flavus]